MKLTKATLKKIIKEEMDGYGSEPEPIEPPDYEQAGVFERTVKALEEELGEDHPAIPVLYDMLSGLGIYL